jgi:glycosyltransferase involved in cell wall biosynthesis
MAALQHGLAIVTTTSDRTDQILVEGGALAFAAADDADGFAAEAVRVGVDPRVREQHALASRALFDRYFSWPIVCAGLRVAIAAAFASPPNRHRLASRGATEPS